MLDAATHYIILPDGIGTGKSTKPSDGLHAKFPKYGYEDMVTAQYRLVTEGLGVNHLLLVMGTSMGCMHSWMWVENYPSMMDGAVPLACFPTQIAGRNRMMRQMMVDAIRADPAYMNGDYTAPPALGLRTAVSLMFMMQSVPLQQQKQYPTRDAAEAAATQTITQRLRSTDANDYIYQYEASRDYDPSRPGMLEKIIAPVLAINSADDQVNPPELGLVEKFLPRVKDAKYVLIPISDQTRGHGTHSLPAIWGPYLADFLKKMDHWEK
jgi:homoserine O-acetyltransferase/O-succinyltransferase